jgi:hypothetical protein
LLILNIYYNRRNHNILLNYTGDDFEVENCSTSLNVHPKITYPFEMECGKDKSIIVQVSKNSKGKIIFTVGKNRYNVTIKDGKAVLSLKNLKIAHGNPPLATKPKFLWSSPILQAPVSRRRVA